MPCHVMSVHVCLFIFIEEKIDDEIEEKVTIIEKFQKILQIQCKALVRLGCDPSVKVCWFLKFAPASTNTLVTYVVQSIVG